MSDPSPDQVLDQAIAAAKEGRYEEALEKHVWYHENALRIQPSLGGVRLSFALMYWYLLARVYPAALSKLRDIRDATIRRVYENDKDADAFSDLVSLNDLLNEPEKTIDVFRWLDEHQPQTAMIAFFYAREVLVEREEFGLCGKYVDATRDIESAVSAYETHLRILDSNFERVPTNRTDEEKELAPRLFCQRTCMLIAILVKNNRELEAVECAAKARKILTNPSFEKEIALVLEGIAPKREGSINPQYWEQYLNEI